MLSLCFLAQCTRREAYGHHVLTPCRKVRPAPLSPCPTVTYCCRMVFSFKVSPNLTKHWGNSSGYWRPRGRLVPVRRSRQCQRHKRGHGHAREGRNGPFAGIPSAIPFNLDTDGMVFELVVARRTLPCLLAEVSFLTLASACRSALGWSIGYRSVHGPCVDLALSYLSTLSQCLPFLHFHGFSHPLPIVCVPLPLKRRQVRRLGTQLLDKKGWRDSRSVPHALACCGRKARCEPIPPFACPSGGETTKSRSRHVFVESSCLWELSLILSSRQ